MVDNIDAIPWKNKNGIIKVYLSRYNILQDGKHVECNVKTWQRALAHAVKYTSSILKEHKVEILNVWTGEIVTYEEALKRAKKYAQRLKGRGQ